MSIDVSSWTEAEIKDYLEAHLFVHSDESDEDYDWDGAEWPGTITTPDGEYCPVCKYTRTDYEDGKPTGTASKDFLHDCVYQTPSSTKAPGSGPPAMRAEPGPSAAG